LNALGFTDQSALLKHELAYVLGQMRNPSALPTLERVLRDLKEDPMVRHEAAEAMGAISSMQSIPTLKEFLNDERREVRETCEIALAKVEWDNSEEGKAETTKFQEKNPWVYQYTVTCGFIYFLQTVHI
jgi:deoxyhypusine monooxygenase